jgi:hypothetical protein
MNLLHHVEMIKEYIDKQNMKWLGMEQAQNRGVRTGRGGGEARGCVGVERGGTPRRRQQRLPLRCSAQSRRPFAGLLSLGGQLRLALPSRRHRLCRQPAAPPPLQPPPLLRACSRRTGRPGGGGGSARGRVPVLRAAPPPAPRGPALHVRAEQGGAHRPGESSAAHGVGGGGEEGGGTLPWMGTAPHTVNPTAPHTPACPAPPMLQCLECKPPQHFHAAPAPPRMPMRSMQGTGHEALAVLQHRCMHPTPLLLDPRANPAHAPTHQARPPTLHHRPSPPPTRPAACR